MCQELTVSELKQELNAVGGPIVFNNNGLKKLSKRPLEPLVQSYYDETLKVLHVSTITFIASKENPNWKGVHGERTYDGSLNFYLCYNNTDVGALSFNAYPVSFSVPNILEQPKEITVYLYDEDPRHSRGTVTTVQPA